MATLRFTKLWSRHATTGSGQVFGTEFRQTNKLIALLVTGIVRDEKGNVRISGSLGGYHFQFTAQLLRIVKSHDARK